MKLNRSAIARFLVASSIALAVPLAAQARPDAEGTPPGDRGSRAEWRHDGADGVPFHLRALQLSEAQRDKIFEITHAQAPAVREQRRAMVKAREALHKLPLAGPYDEAQVQALTQASAKAMAELEQLRARSRYDIYQLLDAEQRKQLDAHEARVQERGHRRHGEHGQRRQAS